jgi:mannose-1-phosphate guanylyltransferase/phosphomannomutase
MKGIILGGGEGTRLKPLTDRCPKVMLKIGEQPVLEHNINLLKNAGIRDILITLYYQPEAVVNYLHEGADFGVKISYLRQPDLLGTAGDLKRAAGKIGSSFVVIYGDNFSNCNLKSVLAEHKRSQRLATLVLFNRQKNPNSNIAGGCVRLEEKLGKILEFREGAGPVTDYINAGIYVLEPQVLNYIPDNVFYDFGKDLFPLLLTKGQMLFGYLLPENEFVFGIDTIDCYERTKLFFQKQSKGVKI